MKKNLFKPVILCLGLLAVTFGCQKEDIKSNEDLNKDSQYQVLRGSVFKSDSIIKTNKALFQLIDSNFSSNASIHSRHIASETYGFTIDTSYVQLLESNDYQSYTFVVHRDNANTALLENYVITFFNSGHYVQHIVNYPRLQDTGTFDIANAIATTINDPNLLTRNSGDCEGFATPVDEWDPNINCVPMACQSNTHMGEAQEGDCEYKGGPGAPYDKCYGGWVTNCEGGFGGGPDPGDGDPSGGGTVPDGDPDIGVSPLEDDLTMQEEILNCLNGPSIGDSVTIDETLFGSLSMSLAQWSAIKDYLNTNACSEDAQELVVLALENDVDVETILSVLDEMDKTCQRNLVFLSIMKVNSTFTNMIKTDYFLSTDNDINLVDLSVGEGNPPLAEESGAATDPNVSTNEDTDADVINVQFNNTHLDQATNLGIVNTFYHELLHAHIYHLYHDGELLATYPEYTDLKTALDNAFADGENVDLQEILNEEMHNIYVDFIDELADSLHKYCIANNISGVDLEYAKKLVWGGLNGYDVFTENLTLIQRIEAQTLLAYENSNITENAKGPKTCND